MKSVIFSNKNYDTDFWLSELTVSIFNIQLLYDMTINTNYTRHNLRILHYILWSSDTWNIKEEVPCFDHDVTMHVQ